MASYVTDMQASRIQMVNYFIILCICEHLYSVDVEDLEKHQAWNLYVSKDYILFLYALNFKKKN